MNSYIVTNLAGKEETITADTHEISKNGILSFSDTTRNSVGQVISVEVAAFAHGQWTGFVKVKDEPAPASAPAPVPADEKVVASA